MLPKIYFALLLCQAAWSMESNPALKVQFSKKGINYGAQTAIHYLEPMLTSLPIEDMHGKANVKVDVDYKVTDIKINKFSISDANITFIPGTGIHVTISNSRAEVSNKWKIHSWVVKDEGSSILNLDGICVNAVINITKTSDGLPSFTITSCSSQVEDVKVKLIGGIEMFNGMMTEPMKKISREKFNQKVCPIMKEQIEKWSKKLKLEQFRMNVNKDVGFDYTLVSNPVTTENDLTFPLKGMFYAVKAPEETPFAPASFSLASLIDNMLCVGISESVFGSAAYSYYRSGFFTFSLDPFLSAGLATMNSTTLAEIFPEVSNQKHQLTGMVQATSAPLVTLKPDNMTLEIAFCVEIYAQLPNSVSKLLVKQNMIASISGNLSLSDHESPDTELKVTGILELNRFQFSPPEAKKQGQAKANPSQVSKMENSIKSLAEQGLLKMLNDQLKRGIDIPNLPFFPLIKPAFKIEQGFIKICGDVKLVPPKV
ncbi:BPI fold-containing family C protein-like [Lissotriton helveticus]